MPKKAFSKRYKDVAGRNTKKKCKGSKAIVNGGGLQQCAVCGRRLPAKVQGLYSSKYRLPRHYSAR